VTDPHLREEALDARDADTIGRDPYLDGSPADLARDAEESAARERARVRREFVRCPDGWTRRREGA
jgi:hypothetical protein